MECLIKYYLMDTRILKSIFEIAKIAAGNKKEIVYNSEKLNFFVI